MKKIIIMTLVLAVFGKHIFSQGKVSFYQVEEENIVQFENYSPNTILEFYGTPQGGTQTNSIILNSLGEGQQIFSIDKTPAFTINKKTSRNKLGTNLVYSLKEHEFITNNIQLNLMSGNVVITWDTQIPNNSDIEFQIVRSDNNSSSEIVKAIKGISGASFHNYSFIEKYRKNSTYALHIVSGDKKLRYASKGINDLSAYKITVYPTLFNNNIHIDIPDLETGTEYVIVDMMQNIVMSGPIMERSTILNLANISRGNYIISVRRHGCDTKNVKITKQ